MTGRRPRRLMERRGTPSQCLGRLCSCNELGFRRLAVSMQLLEGFLADEEIQWSLPLAPGRQHGSVHSSIGDWGGKLFFTLARLQPRDALREIQLEESIESPSTTVMGKTFRSLRPITQSQQIRNIAELDSTTVSLALPTSVDAKAARFIVTLGATESWPRLRFASRTQIWLPGQKSSYWTSTVLRIHVPSREFIPA
ncbi:hypothetical protein M440DRAFT_130133 [Trichoderma longibrachiatum ATCC 18648]|uniref:Uncharacterized protein n=1 Tax=Trichoderma longibrachiatum ATCC 18648 TaxID=983965 RepID=A0A2T4BVW6_TRILO|nr:hypothetical protein M440DRAFT_130133 [Trichoderma longibrachiatum ATCC 18648]